MTDVMFPNGSPDLVEPIYKNPLLSAPFNEQLAAVIRSYVQNRLQVIFTCTFQLMSGACQSSVTGRTGCYALWATMMRCQVLFHGVHREGQQD